MVVVVHRLADLSAAVPVAADAVADVASWNPSAVCFVASSAVPA